MASREIIRHPSEVLSRSARKVGRSTLAKARELIRDLLDTVEEAGGVGLAAPQVGASLRLFVAYDVEKEEFRAYINPRVLHGEGEEVDEEGCLSFGDLVGLVPRYTKIELRYYDDNLKQHRQEFEGLNARILQHEIDHLHGVLILDRSTVPLYKRKEPEEEEKTKEERAEVSTARDSDTAGTRLLC